MVAARMYVVAISFIKSTSGHGSEGGARYGNPWRNDGEIHGPRHQRRFKSARCARASIGLLGRLPLPPDPAIHRGIWRSLLRLHGTLSCLCSCVHGQFNVYMHVHRFARCAQFRVPYYCNIDSKNRSGQIQIKMHRMNSSTNTWVQFFFSCTFNAKVKAVKNNIQNKTVCIFLLIFFNWSGTF